MKSRIIQAVSAAAVFLACALLAAPAAAKAGAQESRPPYVSNRVKIVLPEKPAAAAKSEKAPLKPAAAEQAGEEPAAARQAVRESGEQEQESDPPHKPGKKDMQAAPEQAAKEPKSAEMPDEKAGAAAPGPKAAGKGGEEAMTLAENTHSEKAPEQPGASPGTKSGDKTAGRTEAQQDAIDLLGQKERYYVRKGRPDPFAPFVRNTEPETRSEKKQKLKRREPRTPLERISLGQLRLTAVMETAEKDLALVEEASGKGYVVKEGTYIGNEGGRITEILPEAIVIEEKYLDVFGNVAVRKKQLKLQK